MTIATIGGILLCIGAFMTMLGRVYWAVGVYLIADMCWMAVALNQNDTQGFIFVTIGTILAAISFAKMFFGYMNKDIIKHDKSQINEVV